MNIMTAINNVYMELKEVINNPEVETIHMHNALSKSWRILRCYVKGICKTDVERIDQFLNNYIPELHYLSTDMIKEGINALDRLNRNNVPSFLNGFYELLESLLIFNKPFEDCCWKCQGAYNYLYSDQLMKLVLKCRTCSAIYIIPDDICTLQSDIEVGNLRIATKAELQQMNVVDR